MVRRFSVIQGGLSDAADEAMARRADSTGAAPTWRVDLRRPATIDDGTVGAWRALMVRNAVADPLRDPDHLLPLARHRPAGRRVAVALAWSREADGPEILRGVVPLAMPHPVWGGRARIWQPEETGATAAIDRNVAEAVDAALRSRLRALRRPIRLVGSLDAGPAPAPGRRIFTLRHPSGARRVPAHSIIGVRPEGWEPADAERVSVSEPGAVRDAVETFLTLDARTARDPIIADPSHASFVRVVSRLFGRRHALRVDLFRRAGEVVAGTLHLGTGPAATAWLRARV